MRMLLLLLLTMGFWRRTAGCDPNDVASCVERLPLQVTIGLPIFGVHDHQMYVQLLLKTRLSITDLMRHQLL